MSSHHAHVLHPHLARAAWRDVAAALVSGRAEPGTDDDRTADCGKHILAVLFQDEISQVLFNTGLIIAVSCKASSHVFTNLIERKELLLIHCDIFPLASPPIKIRKYI